MPVQSSWNRSPLRANRFTPLPIGAVRASGWLGDKLSAQNERWLETLEQNSARDESSLPRAMEALLYVSRVTGDASLLRHTDRAFARLFDLDEAGGGNRSIVSIAPESYVAPRAALHYFEATGDARAIQYALRHCADQLGALVKSAPGDPESLAVWGEFAYIALNAYNHTGRAQLLKLAQKWSRIGLDWTGWYHRFPQIQPMNRSIPSEQLARIAREERAQMIGAVLPFHTHLSLAARGDMAAMGLRACAVKSMFTGGLKDEQAFSIGFEKLIKNHGVAADMFTCDEYLEGRDPSKGISSAAVCETMRALITALWATDDVGWIARYADILERLAFNLIPAAISPDARSVQEAQRVNQIECSAVARAHYSLSDDAGLYIRRPPTDPVASRLFGALPEYVVSLWMRAEDAGLAMMGAAPCVVRHRVDGRLIRLDVETAYPYEETVRIRISCKDPVKLPIYLRIPAWANGAFATLPDGQTLECSPGTFVRVERVFRSGDCIRLTLPMRPELVEVSPANLSVAIGPTLYALPIEARETAVSAAAGEEAFAYSACSEWKVALAADAELEKVPALRTGEPPLVRCSTAQAPGWGVKHKAAAAPPRDPEILADSICERTLTPYAQTRLRIAQFPAWSAQTACELARNAAL